MALYFWGLSPKDTSPLSNLEKNLQKNTVDKKRSSMKSNLTR